MKQIASIFCNVSFAGQYNKARMYNQSGKNTIVNTYRNKLSEKKTCTCVCNVTYCNCKYAMYLLSHHISLSRIADYKQIQIETSAQIMY